MTMFNDISMDEWIRSNMHPFSAEIRGGNDLFVRVFHKDCCNVCTDDKYYDVSAGTVQILTSTQTGHDKLLESIQFDTVEEAYRYAEVRLKMGLE